MIDFLKLCVEVAYCSPWKTYFMAFEIKDQTKAAAALRSNFAIYGLILLKLCVEVAYWSQWKIYYMAFAIKGQTNRLQVSRAIAKSCPVLCTTLCLWKGCLVTNSKHVQNTFNFIFSNHKYNKISVKIRTVQSKFMRYFSLFVSL